MKQLIKLEFETLLNGAYPDCCDLCRESTGIVGHGQPYYPLFKAISAFCEPKFVVELGSWRGFGAAHFAMGNKKTTVATIDIHKDDKVAQQRCIQISASLPNMHYINKWTWDAIPDIERFGMPIDILFIDAWHEYQYAKKEWDLYEPFLADDALVICDDIFDSAGTTDNMVQLWDEIKNLNVKTNTGKTSIVWSILNTVVHYPVPMGFLRYRRTYGHIK